MTNAIEHSWEAQSTVERIRIRCTVECGPIGGKLPRHILTANGSCRCLELKSSQDPYRPSQTFRAFLEAVALMLWYRSGIVASAMGTVVICSSVAHETGPQCTSIALSRLFALELLPRDNDHQQGCLAFGNISTGLCALNSLPGTLLPPICGLDKELACAALQLDVFQTPNCIGPWQACIIDPLDTCGTVAKTR